MGKEMNKLDDKIKEHKKSLDTALKTIIHQISKLEKESETYNKEKEAWEKEKERWETEKEQEKEEWRKQREEWAKEREDMREQIELLKASIASLTPEEGEMHADTKEALKEELTKALTASIEDKLEASKNGWVEVVKKNIKEEAREEARKEEILMVNTTLEEEKMRQARRLNVRIMGILEKEGSTLEIDGKTLCKKLGYKEEESPPFLEAWRAAKIAKCTANQQNEVANNAPQVEEQGEPLDAMQPAEQPADFQNLQAENPPAMDHWPSYYKEAIDSTDSKKWHKAMLSEMDSLEKSHTWDLVDLPKGAKALPCKWVYKTKVATNASSKYKARLVAKGYKQKHGVDFDEIFSPVVKLTTLWIVLALVAALGMDLRQMDVKTAFLHGVLHEVIYMLQPEGFVVKGKERKVCRLLKSLYGLKQSPRAWYHRFDTFMRSQGYKRSNADHCLYTKKASDGSLLLPALYVDDMLIGGTNVKELDALQNSLREHCDMKDLDDALCHQCTLELKPLSASCILVIWKLDPNFEEDPRPRDSKPLHDSIEPEYDDEGNALVGGDIPSSLSHRPPPMKRFETFSLLNSLFS
ncbi:hypothetical protein L7F22_034205 [Adiantum nelumboides]|nr:hypothetical protein [Adiantum nelumboides]